MLDSIERNAPLPLAGTLWLQAQVPRVAFHLEFGDHHRLVPFLPAADWGDGHPDAQCHWWPGVEVQVDESKFGKRKHNRGHRVEGVWVFGGVETTDERKCFMVKVPNRNRDTLHALIKKHILPGSIIRSDGHPSCEKLHEIPGHCCEHEVVVHDHNLVNPVTGCHTNNTKGTWNGVKTDVPVRQRTEEHAVGHLHEFMWRRQNADRTWQAVMDAIGTVRHVWFFQLINNHLAQVIFYLLDFCLACLFPVQSAFLVRCFRIVLSLTVATWQSMLCSCSQCLPHF